MATQSGSIPGEMGRVSRLLRRIPDFPKPGILFRDITPILHDPEGLKLVLDGMEAELRKDPPNLIVAVESRGFLFGVALADRLSVGFVPVRKPGKLPWETESVTYDLEYGQDSLEIHRDAIGQGQKVWIVDDLLATGGTAEATAELVRRLGGEILGFCFLVELVDLDGRSRLSRLGRVAALLRE